jgi:hypothetical protein
MYEHIDPNPDAEFPLSLYEDGSRNSQRRSLRYQPARQRRQQARVAQTASGLRYRIWRKVLNEEDFADELRIWHPAQQNGDVKRKNYREFTLTVFDTNQQPIRHVESYTEEELTELLMRKRPQLFEPTGRIATAGVAPFGNKTFLALHFGEQLEDDRVTARNAIAPELMIDDSHQLVHRSHVSLGKILVKDAAQRARVCDELRAQLEPVIPKFAEFGPAQVDVFRQSQAA